MLWCVDKPQAPSIASAEQLIGPDEWSEVLAREGISRNLPVRSAFHLKMTTVGWFGSVLNLNPPTLFCEAFAKCVRGGGLG